MSMLQKILKEMYVEPELLEELDEEQRQILFCKMREEQLRRWVIGEEEFEESEKTNPRKRNKNKKIEWLKGPDGEPWVWVMGEHEEDMTIDEIVDQNFQDTARKLAEEEAEKLRLKEEEELKEKLRMDAPLHIPPPDYDLSPIPPPNAVAAAEDRGQQDNEDKSEESGGNKSDDNSTAAAAAAGDAATPTNGGLETTGEGNIRSYQHHGNKPSIQQQQQNSTNNNKSNNIKPVRSSTPGPTSRPAGDEHGEEEEDEDEEEEGGDSEIVPVVIENNAGKATSSVSTAHGQLGTDNRKQTGSRQNTAGGNGQSTTTANNVTHSQEYQELMQKLREAKVVIRQHKNSDFHRTSIQGRSSISSNPEDEELEIRLEREALEKKLRDEAERRIEEEKERRASEIYQSLKEAQIQANEEAEKQAETEKRFWQQQEQKSRKAESEIRDLAKRAREAHRSQGLRTVASVLDTIQPSSSFSAHAETPMTSTINQTGLLQQNNNTNNLDSSAINLSASLNSSTDSRTDADSPSGSSTAGMKSSNRLPRPPKPKSRAAIVDWFRRDEAPRGTGRDPKTNLVAPWFHGLISRNAAEQLLKGRTFGSFLVRVSEKIWGFTLSFATTPIDVKHFLIERVPAGYQFLGTQQIVHKQLWDLISYHESVPVTNMGREVLREPVGQSDFAHGPPDYLELFPAALNYPSLKTIANNTNSPISSLTSTSPFAGGGGHISSNNNVMMSKNPTSAFFLSQQNQQYHHPYGISAKSSQVQPSSAAAAAAAASFLNNHNSSASSSYNNSYSPSY